MSAISLNAPLIMSPEFSFPANDSAAAISADIKAIDAWRERELELAAIREFSDDWDGRGSAAPTAGAVNAAALFLTICKKINASDAPARISLGPDGFVSVEWLYGETLISAEVQSNNEIEWMKATAGEKTEFFSTPLADETGPETEQVQTWQPAPVAEEEPGLVFAQ
jgi:hypothetical protein